MSSKQQALRLVLFLTAMAILVDASASSSTGAGEVAAVTRSPEIYTRRYRRSHSDAQPSPTGLNQAQPSPTRLNPATALNGVAATTTTTATTERVCLPGRES